MRSAGYWDAWEGDAMCIGRASSIAGALCLADSANSRTRLAIADINGEIAERRRALALANIAAGRSSEEPAADLTDDIAGFAEVRADQRRVFADDLANAELSAECGAAR